jgi:hypothetical protein
MMTGRERVEHLLQALQWWTGGMEQQCFNSLHFALRNFPWLQVVEVNRVLIAGIDFNVLCTVEEKT